MSNTLAKIADSINPLQDIAHNCIDWLATVHKAKPNDPDFFQQVVWYAEQNGIDDIEEFCHVVNNIIGDMA